MAGSKVHHGLIAACVTVVLVCVAVLAWSAPKSSVPLRAPPAHAATSAAATTFGATDRPPIPAASSTPAERSPAVPLTQRDEIATPSGPATIRGRCVDDRGKPLAGVRIRLVAEPTGGAAHDSYFPMPAQTTGEDGRFELRFDPPADKRFWLDVDAFERVLWRGSWRHIEPGRTIDCGDLRLSEGVLVSGVVLDADGEAQRGGRLDLRRAAAPLGDGVHPCASVSAHVGSDGAFTFEHPVLPGHWTASVSRAIDPGTRVTQVEAAVEWSRPLLLSEVELSRADPQPFLRLQIPATANRERSR